MDVLESISKSSKYMQNPNIVKYVRNKLSIQKKREELSKIRDIARYNKYSEKYTVLDIIINGKKDYRASVIANKRNRKIEDYRKKKLNALHNRIINNQKGISDEEVYSYISKYLK